MADLRADIQNALTYIEENLTEELEIRDIAKRLSCLRSISNESLVSCAASALVSISAVVDYRLRGRNWQDRMLKSSILRQSTVMIRRTVSTGPFSVSMVYLPLQPKKQVPD